jgi:hypothetical protein
VRTIAFQNSCGRRPHDNGRTHDTLRAAVASGAVGSSHRSDPDDCRNQMQKKDGEIAHGANLTRSRHSQEMPTNCEFAMHRCRAARMRRTTSLSMGIPKARVIWCAIRGHPQLGFRCFMSRTAAMTSWLGPLGPGFIVGFDEKSRRYFR